MNPNELQQRVTMENAEGMAALERQIDAGMVQNFNGGDRVNVPITTGYRGPYDDPKNDLPGVCIQTVLDKYRQAGWQAKVQSDQREGTWVELKRPNQYVGPYGNGVNQNDR